ncbi:MAG TPA: thioredoxin fold domain-containing protein [Steroidobacteraceae bacterium]|nr:thioredoxin fold domain-containing protein [Steroidobacteraceae bacterium]
MKRLFFPGAATLVLLLSAVAAALMDGSPARAQSLAAGGSSPVSSTAVVPGGMSPALPAAAPGGGAPDGVAPSPIPGVVEVRRGADIVYMSQDGKYVLTGDLYRVDKHIDLTEQRRRELRRELIDALPESQMLVFAPKHPQYTVTVFTDVDCVYCRALHGQIGDYNSLGIKVRYVFFPRTGPNSSSWYKAEQVWCSSDRHAALTRAKLGEPLSARVCATNPVAREYALGQAIGLEGTPGIVAANGALVGGYLPPKALLAALKDSAQPPTAAPAN